MQAPITLFYCSITLYFSKFPARAEPRTSISCVGGDPRSGSPERLMLVLGSALHIENQRKQNLTSMTSAYLGTKKLTYYFLLVFGGQSYVLLLANSFLHIIFTRK